MGATEEIDEYENLKSGVVNSGTVFHGAPVPVDEKTATEEIALPHPLRPAVLDNVRIRNALAKIDAALAARATNDDLTALDSSVASVQDGVDTLASSLSSTQGAVDSVETGLESVQSDVAEKVSFEATQSLDVNQQQRARSNISAAPRDVLAHHGVQVNGSFLASQEFGHEFESSSGDAYICDQMAGGNAVTAAGIVSATNPLPSFASVRLRSMAARPSYGSTEFDWLYSPIEGTRLRNRLFWGTPAAKPLFVSFMVVAETSGRFYLSIRNFDATRAYLVPFDLVANQPAVCWAVIPGDTSGTWKTDHSIGLEISWCFGSGALYGSGIANAWQGGNHIAAPDVSNFFPTVNSNVWLGPWVAIPGADGPKTFDELVRCQRPYEEELRLCHRYWFLRADYPTFTRTTTAFNKYFKNFYFDETRVSPAVSHDRNDAYIHKPNIRWDTQADFTYAGGNTGVICNIVPTTDDPAALTLETWTTFQFNARM